MGCAVYLITLLWVGQTVDTRGVLLLELTQVKSGDNVTLVCTAAHTTINMSITTWFRNEARVLNILSGNNDCFIHPPNNTDNTAGYRYDLYSSKGVSVSCTTFQHNLTLTTAKYLEARDVWRCRDQNFRSSNNLTSVVRRRNCFFRKNGDICPTIVSVSCSYLQHNLTLTTTEYVKSGTVWRCKDQNYRNSNNLTSVLNVDFSGSVSESTPPLTDSSTTLGISTSRKTTPDTNTYNKGAIMYITAWTVGGSVFLVIIVVCVCVLRKKRKRKVTEDIDVSLPVVAAPVYDTLTHDASDDPCYTGIKMGDAGQSGTNVIDVYYNTVPNADYENPPLRT